MHSGAVMAEDNRNLHPVPPKASREPLGASNPPGPMQRRPSTIPPPPLPVVQPQPIPLIPKKQSVVDEDCVTRRFFVDVFQPVGRTTNMPTAGEGSVDSIRITPEDTPHVAYKQTLFEIDEDAVTREFRIHRDSEPSGGYPVHETAMRIRTLPSDDTLWKNRLARRSAAESPRKGLLSALVPSLMAAVEKATTLFQSLGNHRHPAGVRTRALKKHAGAKTDRDHLRLSVNSYTRDLYREIRNALNPASSREVLRVGTHEYAVAVSEPPKIAVNALLLRRSDKFSLLLRGKASHPIAIRDIMVFADKKKILYLSNAMRDDAGYMEFSADVPLMGAVSSVLVVARHDDHVMGSQSLVITKSN